MIDLERQDCVYVNTRLQILNYEKTLKENGNELYLFKIIDNNNSFYSFSDGSNAFPGTKKNDIIDIIEPPEFFNGTGEEASRIILNSDNTLDCMFNFLRDEIINDKIYISSITKERKLTSLVILNKNNPTVLYNNNRKGAVMSDSEFCNKIKSKFDKLSSSVIKDSITR